MTTKAEGFQYLEDIATAAWYGEALFLAVEKELFAFGDEEHTVEEYSRYLGFEPEAAHRYLLSLEAMGLLKSHGRSFVNAPLAREYLVPQSRHYQGHSILWRRKLCRGWQNLENTLTAGGRTDFPVDDDESAIKERFRHYSFAMDDIARCKGTEIADFCPVEITNARILDVGSGLGAVSRSFLERWPDATATFADMGEVMDLCQEVLPETILRRVRRCAFNVLEPWKTLAGETFDLIIMSNIVHAFDKDDNLALMGRVAEHLSDDGLVLIHDFFRGHWNAKAAMLDLNMLLNTYNGRVFALEDIHDIVRAHGLYHTGLLPLPSDTALIAAAKKRETLIPWEEKGRETP
ncbi:MAG: class I SAM-dependent methyltransferase [Bacillota bacterium]|nr:class I SAM-dependent methyltransferase [Bacillota bacterium]